MNTINAFLEELKYLEVFHNNTVLREQAEILGIFQLESDKFYPAIKMLVDSAIENGLAELPV